MLRMEFVVLVTPAFALSAEDKSLYDLADSVKAWNCLVLQKTESSPCFLCG